MPESEKGTTLQIVPNTIHYEILLTDNVKIKRIGFYYHVRFKVLKLSNNFIISEFIFFANISKTKQNNVFFFVLFNSINNMKYTIVTWCFFFFLKQLNVFE